jgi:hypothetical protein
MCPRVGVRWFGDVGKKQDGEISPISSALHTPRSARGGALTPISELAARGIDLIRRLPDESAIGLIEALLNNESLVAAGVRTRLRKPAKQPPRKSGEIYSVKHNCCTQNGLLPTLGVITEGSLDVEGVLLDQFGQWPESANEYSRVRLDEEQAYQLTLRMEFAGARTHARFVSRLPTLEVVYARATPTDAMELVHHTYTCRQDVCC